MIRRPPLFMDHCSHTFFSRILKAPVRHYQLYRATKFVARFHLEQLLGVSARVMYRIRNHFLFIVVFVNHVHACINRVQGDFYSGWFPKF